ncbi:MAG: DUF494 family protein [Candidatus Cloacimonetes bacterium]|nr:DUF494 family protein [Candidatus Cloacimonadota bacterium]
MKRLKRKEQGLQKILERLGLKGLTADIAIVSKTYNRILTPEERKLLDTDSFGYLLSLYQIGTIDTIKLEQYIDYCLTIAYYEKEKLSLERTKKIVSMLLFCDNMFVMNREFADFFKEFEQEIIDDDKMH